MRRKMRKLIVVMVIMLGLLGNHSVVYADTTMEEGISVSVETDKSTYEKDEEITIITTVKNLKGVSIQNFSLENVIPDGFKVVNGTKNGFDQKELKSGEEIVLSTTIIEGEDNTGLVIGIVLLIVIAGIAGVAFVLKQKKQAMAVMIVFTFCISNFGPYGVAIVQAKNEKSLSKESIINYDSNELRFLTNMDYEEEVPVGNVEDTITKGEWVKLLLEKTETDLMNVENESYYYFSDTKDSEFGLAVETAYRRGYLPQEESNEFGINEVAEREFVAYTVYYAMGFDGEYVLECNDLAELNYSNECALLVQQGFLSLIDEQFMPKNALTMYDKEQILGKIAYFNDSLDLFSMEEIYEVEYVDGVVLLETESYESVENNNQCTVTLSADVDVSKLETGTIFVVTEKQPYEMSAAFKVVMIQVEDEKTTIECVRPQIEEVVKEYKISGKEYLDPENFIPEEGVEVEFVSNDASTLSLARGGIKDSIKFGEMKFKLKDKIGDKSGLSVEGSFSVSVPEISFLVGGEGDCVEELAIKVSSKEKLTGVKVKWDSELEEGKRTKEDKIKIGTFPLCPLSLGVSARVTVYVECEISGEISMSWEVESLSGLQYKDGAFRKISDATVASKEVDLEAKLKLGAAPNVTLVFLKCFDIVGVDISIGAAGEASRSVHTDVTPNLTCSDAGVYIYLTLKLDEENPFGKALKSKNVSLSCDIWKSSNSPWKKVYHMENGEMKDKCTYGKGHIFGRIVDETGEIVRNVKVVITQVNGTYTAETYSAIEESAEYEKGEFGFENVPIGEYKIEISLGELYKGSSTVTVESGERAECWNIVLEEVSDSDKPVVAPEPTPTPEQQPTPNPEPTPEPGETVTSSYQLSSQGYDYASQVSDKYYVVGNGSSYGLVDYNGNVIVPMQYEKHSVVAKNEVQFTKGNIAYVYNTDTGKLVIEYVTEELVESKVIEKFTTESGRNVTVESQNYYYEFDKGASIYRAYQGGILREDLYTWWIYEDTEDYYWSSQGHWLSTYKNVYNNTTIYSGYTDWAASDIMCWNGSFSSDKSESVAVMLEVDKLSGDISLVIINVTGYERKNISNLQSEGTRASYDNGWLKLYWPDGEMINVNTMSKINMPFESYNINYWYHGHGEYYALSTDGSSYSICKDSTILKNNCLSVDFANANYIIYKRSDGKFVYMNYNGTELLTVNDYGNFVNGRAIVNDGIGIYMIDENLNKVSDYIYKGAVENCHSGAIKINGKYYLIGKK